MDETECFWCGEQYDLVEHEVCPECAAEPMTDEEDDEEDEESFKLLNGSEEVVDSCCNGSSCSCC